MTNPNLTVFNIMEEEHLTKRRLGCEKVEKRKKKRYIRLAIKTSSPLSQTPKLEPNLSTIPYQIND